MSSIAGVVVSQLLPIRTDGGEVMHGLKRSDATFAGFGEVYFSSIEPGCIRGWKRHREMTLNLVVVTGEIRFVLLADENGSHDNLNTFDISLSPARNYARLTVPPGIWMGFQGLAGPTSLLANIANMEHDPGEVDRAALNNFHYDWD